MATNFKNSPESKQENLSLESTQEIPMETPSHLDIMTFVFNAGFKIVTILFIILGLIFILSNSYWVPEGSVAVHSRLGSLSQVELAVKAPGGPYFALPFPVDKIIKLPTTIQHVTIDKAFMIEDSSSSDISKTLLKTDSFKPGVHGSLITGDKNIVQGTWEVHFRLDFSTEKQTNSNKVLLFVNNIGTIDKANGIIRILAEEAIISVIAGMSVSDFISGRIDHNVAKGRIQQRADSLRLGIAIVSISASHYGAPAALESDFQAATQAESEKALQIEKAMRYRTTTLNEVAGEQWQELLKAITSHEQAVTSNNFNEQKNTLNDVEEILLSAQIGGTVASKLDIARTEKTSTIEKTRSSVSRFTELLTAYRRDPFVLKNQLFQDVLLEVWGGHNVKVRWLPPGQRLYISDLENSQQD